MNQRTGTTHVTDQRKRIIFTFLILTIHSPLFAPPRLHKRARNQDASYSQNQPYPQPLSHIFQLRSLIASTPDTFRCDHETKLLHAIDLFHEVPGFVSTLKKALNQARQSPLAHGYLYEIETALTSQEEQNDPVCYFGREHHATMQGRNHEIDVETQRFYIECKDIFWGSRHLLLGPEKIRRQLREERDLVNEKNRQSENPKTFLLCSKQPIPLAWQQWLKDNNIAYDCPDDTSSSGDQSSQSSKS